MGLLFPATLAGGMVLFPARADLGRLSEKDSPLRIGIDPNSTHWFELAQLPGIGESLARKIVDYRESRRASSQGSNRPVFATPEDLLPVNGIGVRSLARIRPFLIFPSPLPG